MEFYWNRLLGQICNRTIAGREKKSKRKINFTVTRQKMSQKKNLFFLVILDLHLRDSDYGNMKEYLGNTKK